MDAYTSYASTSVTATNINAVGLSNVNTDNGGQSFGIQAGTIKWLGLSQSNSFQLWNRDFTSNVGDFIVTIT